MGGVPFVKGGKDHKRVLAIQKLVILIARHRAFVEDARLSWILNLQRRYDGRDH
jgi:hypothetical protein